MKKLLLLLIIILYAGSAIAEDVSYISGQAIPSNGKINIGVTDDVNKNACVLRTDANCYLKATLGTALNSANDSIAVDFVSTSVSNISTITTTSVGNGTNSALNKMVVNTGASGTATFYDNALATCSGTPSNYRFTLSTTNAGILDIGHVFTNGICIVTSATANISILYKDLP